MMVRSRPDVSVVIPCHNAAKWLGETLASTLAQSYRDLEVVLVDDGSDDRPEDVVAKLNDERIRVLVIAASGSPSRPRNVGIANSRGRIVFFCDADDVMMPGKIERQVALLESQPDVGMSFTDFAVVDAAGLVIEPSFISGFTALRRLRRRQAQPPDVFSSRSFLSALLCGNFIGTSGVAVRRSVLDDVGGFVEDLASSEDYDLWLRIARRHRCALVDIVGHRYRRHPESLMQEDSVRHPLARIRVLEKQLPLVDSVHDRRAVHRRLAVNFSSVGFGHERSGDLTAARAAYRASLRHWFLASAAWGAVKTSTVGARLLHRTSPRG